MKNNEEHNKSEEVAPCENNQQEPQKTELNHTKNKADFIKNEIDKSIAKFNRKHKFNNKFGTLIKFLALGLSAIVTILLGLKLEHQAIYNSIALIISALTGVVYGIAAFFDFNELAIKYKDTIDKLDILKFKIEYLTLGDNVPSEEELDELKDGYVNTLKNMYEYFQEMRKDEGSQTKT